jgi:hypothetical protein
MYPLVQIRVVKGAVRVVEEHFRTEGKDSQMVDCSAQGRKLPLMYDPKPLLQIETEKEERKYQ